MSLVFCKQMGTGQIILVLANRMLLYKAALDSYQLTFKLSTKSVEIVFISVLMVG